MPTEQDSPTSCLMVIKYVKWVPVLFIASVLIWSYYAYVYVLCLMNVDAVGLQIVYLVAYHIALGMLVWCYWRTIFTSHGFIPDKFRVVDDVDCGGLSGTIDNNVVGNEPPTHDQRLAILEVMVRNLPVYTFSVNGLPRYCDRCKIIKPDRAHHCSVCRRCVLKMDHHCPWVNNCISFTNYKYFLLFLTYALIYCIYVALTSLPYVIQFWKTGVGDTSRFQIFFICFVAIMFALSIISLFGYHCYLVCKNCTTLEAFRTPVFRNGQDKNGFNMGCYNNFIAVFGDNWLYWFLPTNSSYGNGIEFAVQSRHLIGTNHSMDFTTQTSARDVTRATTKLNADCIV